MKGLRKLNTVLVWGFAALMAYTAVRNFAGTYGGDRSYSPKAWILNLAIGACFVWWNRVRKKREDEDRLRTVLDTVILATFFFVWFFLKYGTRKDSLDTLAVFAMFLSILGAVACVALAIARAVNVRKAKKAASEAREKYAAFKIGSGAPHHIGIAECVYQYDGIAALPFGPVTDEIISCAVTFCKCEDPDQVMILIGDEIIGVAEEKGHVPGMIRQWLDRGDPMVAMIDYVNSETSEFTFAIFFYRDEFRRIGEDAPRYVFRPTKLVEGLQPGTELTLGYSEYSEAWELADYDGNRMGTLPADQIRNMERRYKEEYETGVKMKELLKDGEISFYFGGSETNEDGVPVPYLLVRM